VNFEKRLVTTYSYEKRPVNESMRLYTSDICTYICGSYTFEFWKEICNDILSWKETCKWDSTRQMHAHISAAVANMTFKKTYVTTYSTRNFRCIWCQIQTSHELATCILIHQIYVTWSNLMHQIYVTWCQIQTSHELATCDRSDIDIAYSYIWYIRSMSHTLKWVCNIYIWSITSMSDTVT